MVSEQTSAERQREGKPADCNEDVYEDQSRRGTDPQGYQPSRVAFPAVTGVL
ncbi:hypothetical protein ACNKHW_19930 [Shigella flexneri]